MGWEWCGNRGKLREEIVASPLSHSPFEGKKKLVTISTAQLNWTPILGEAMLYSFIIFLDYLSWIKFGQVNLLIKKCDFEDFWDLGLHLSACTNLNALGTGDRVVALIFSWKLLHRSLVGGPKKHPSLFSIKTFFFFFEI